MEGNEEQGIVVDAGASQVFDRTEKMPTWMSVGEALINAVWFLVKWVFGVIVDVLKTLWSVIAWIGKLLYNVGRFFYKLARDLCHKFKYNDMGGRLSFVIFGASNYAHGQIVNGLILSIFEVAYVVLFAMYGVNSIGMLGSLGTQATQSVEVCDDEIGCYSVLVSKDNSILILIFGLLWVFSIVLFFMAWRASINGGYRNYRITNYRNYADLFEKIEPESKEIDDDISANHLFDHKFKELKERYALVYANFEAKAEGRFETDFGEFTLDETIRHCLGAHKELESSRAHLAKREARIEKFDKNPKYLEKIAAKEKALEKEQAELDAMSETYWALYDKSELGVLNESDMAAFETAKRARRSLRNRVLVNGDTLIAKKKSHEKRVDKLDVKRRQYQTEIDDGEKHYLNAVAKLLADNDSKYGSFNKFYKNESEYAVRKSFYENYEKIGVSYDEGYASFEKANADNVGQRQTLANDYADKCAKIRANYAQVRAHREKSITEAGIKYPDSPKTVKAVIASLPSLKQIGAMEKEEIDNVTHSYKRDAKALKTNYTAETYAEFSATSYMIVNCAIPFEAARVLVKDVKSRLQNGEAKEELDKLNRQNQAYVSGHPDKFDGKPKTLKEQIGSLLDENFHLTLLALPILGVVFFTVMPLFFSILIAFTNYSKGHEPISQLFGWIGLDNFKNLFFPDSNSIYASLADDMGTALVWTLVWAVLATFSNYYLGILYALMINKEGIRFKKFWRTIFVLSIAMPQFISLIAISLILNNSGPFGHLWFNTFGTNLNFGDKIDGRNGAIVTKTIIILVNIWIGVPYTILQTTGILLNIPRDLYESSEIDGAGKGRQFFSITMPYIRFVLGPSLITTFIGNVNNFGVIYFLTGGGPTITNSTLGLGHTDLLITFLYKLVTSSSNPQYGIASTIGIVVFVICAFFSIIVYNKSDAVTKEDQFQ
ncbi:MAG: ABC transporter permease subunit [Bacilli bacterium]|jgi:arabinogalactan oligomer/maltooligosaccharide transport system permease protein|nr:ABC transporter permease subunit [Bacilli bacterium]